LIAHQHKQLCVLDEYYTEPMEKVEKVVTGRLEKVEKLCNWNKEFLVRYVKVLICSLSSVAEWFNRA